MKKIFVALFHQHFEGKKVQQQHKSGIKKDI